MTSTLTVLTCVLAALFGASNAYIAASVGITPNMALAGALLGGLMGGVATRPNSAQEELTAMQTLITAGNACASGVGFTLPILLLQPGAMLSAALLGRVCLVVAAGLSLAFLTITVNRTHAPSQRSDNAKSNNEGSAIVRFIQDLASQACTGAQMLPLLIASAAIGVVSAVANAFVPFVLKCTFKLSELPLSIGWNPAMIALGTMLGVTETVTLLGGSTLTALLQASASASPSVFRIPSLSAYLDVSALKPVAALVLGLGSLQILGKLVWRGYQSFAMKSAAAKEPNLPTSLPLPTLVARLAATVFLVVGVAVLASTVHSLVTVVGILALTVLGVVLAQRVVRLTGVTLNPSSAMGFFGAAIVLAVYRLEGLGVNLPVMSILLTAAFMITAASFGATLAQDFMVMTGAGVAPEKLIRRKWWLSIAIVPVAALTVACAVWALAGEGTSLDQIRQLISAQPLALDAFIKFMAQPDSRFSVLLALAAAIFAACTVTRTNAILIGIGMIVPMHVATALTLGAAFMQVLRKSQLTDNQGVGAMTSSAASAGSTTASASLLATYAIAATICGIVAASHSFHPHEPSPMIRNLLVGITAALVGLVVAFAYSRLSQMRLRTS